MVESFHLPCVMSEEDSKRTELFGKKQRQEEDEGDDKVDSDDEFEASKVEADIRKTRNQTKASLQRTKRMLEETKEIGSKTATTMENQTKQMQRIRGDAADVEDYLQKSRGVVDDMNRNWISRLLFYNRKDTKPPPVEWNNRNEEQLGAAKAMIDKQKKINRKKKALASKRRAEEKAKKRPWWLGGKKGKKPKQPKDSDDDSSLADDLDDLSLEDEDDADVMPGGREGTVGVEPVKKTLSEKPDATNYREKLGLKTRPLDDDELSSANSSTFSDDVDKDLDQIRSSIGDVRNFAERIQAQSQRQDELATDLQGQIERNNQMVGDNKDQLRRVNRRVKKLQQEQEKDEGFLNANDKLAIQGLTQSFKSKVNG
ncbi:hypothetical protein FOZ62_019598 [Perkinsus olseni]|uniref:t-SNARE coiled-coil homology domain-containing protein n=2 Tax=Perkinsus olseni TaxID=32597 RepID=A0A7J6SUR8_PEROL|nr:hypothetical protein FOZ62_019598 [Perkinsus olseni]